MITEEKPYGLVHLGSLIWLSDELKEFDFGVPCYFLVD